MKYYIRTYTDSPRIIESSTEPINAIEGTIVYEVELDEFPKPDTKDYYDSYLTYDGNNFGTEYSLNIDDVNARKLTLRGCLTDNDYKNLKNFEKVWCLKAKSPGITDAEIIAQLPYNPIEVSESHDKWREELNNLEKLVPQK